MTEFIMGVVGSIVQKGVESIVVHGGFFIFPKRNVDKLRTAARKLGEKQADLQAFAEDEQRQEREVPGISRWLETAGLLHNEADAFLQTSVDLTNIGPVSRYKTGKKAAKMTGAVDELCREADVVSSKALPRSRRVGLFISDSRKRIIEQAMEALKDESTSLVSIWGEPDVGKTIVAKQIVEQVVEEKLFGEVRLVVVSRQPDVRKIRNGIGDAILVRIENKTGIARAVDGLQERVMGNKTRVLLVLDDVWDGFDLESLKLAPPGSRAGYKILLTSRSQHVCQGPHSLMIQLQPLPRQEAAFLFWNKVGTAMTSTIDNPEKLFIEDQILAECNGLPRALVLAATQFARGERFPWNGTLEELSRANSSYEQLQSKEAKMLYLLCCIFAPDQDIPIESLLRFGMGSGVFDSNIFIREAREQAHSLVENLKSSSLLSLGTKKECVKISVARELAMRVIADKDGFGLTDTVKWYQQQPSSPQGSEQLKFLDFSIVSSTDPLAELNKNLHTLSLSYCQLQGKELSCIGTLEQLQILSFAHSDVQELTCETKLPPTLRLLDLTKCKSLKTISPGVLGGLPLLEELYTLGTSVEWEIHLNELANSSRLTSLTVHVPSAEHLPQGLLLGKDLTRFQIFIGDFSCPWDEHLHDFTNRLGLCIPSEACADKPEASSSETEPASALMQLFRAKEPDQVSLFQNLSSLEFHSCNDLSYLFSAATARQFVKLHTLKILNCKMVAVVIDNADGDTKLPELRTLVLKNLPRLERFWASDESCSFEWPMLETVRVKGMPMMKTFAPGSHTTPRLRAVHVTFLDKCWKDDLNATFDHIYSSFHQAKGVDGQRQGASPSSSHGS